MAQTPKNYRAAIATLTLAGLISGLSSAIADASMRHFLADIFIGAFFGLALSAGLAFWGRPSLWKILILVVASVAAWKISRFLTAMALLGWPFGRGDSGHDTPASVFCVGGFTGAFLLLLAVLFLIFPQEKLWRIAASALVWSIGGAALGITGWALGPALGVPIWRVFHPHLAFDTARIGEAANDISLFLVWQTGMTCLLGVALQRHSLRSRSSPASSIQARQRQLSAAGIIFFALLTLGVAYRLYGWFLTYEEAREAPSMDNLPTLNPANTNEALILDGSIGEYDADPASVENMPAGKDERDDVYFPYSGEIDYSVDYRKHADVGGIQGIISVSVSQYPNSAWARYGLKSRVPEVAAPKRGDVRNLSRQGNNILSRLVYGSPHYYWVSGNMLVAIHFSGSEPESLLSAYLKRYPSSL